MPSLLMGIRWFSSDTKVMTLYFLSFCCPSLQKGDSLALTVTPEGELRFFLNGMQLGAGITSTTEGGYGFIELRGWKGDCVRLILSEVRKWKWT